MRIHYRKIERVGYIGLGVMGEGMCRNLVAKGKWPVTVFDLNDDAMDRLVQLGAQKAQSAAALLESVDMVMLCLPGGAQVEALMQGPDGLLSALQPGQMIIDHSTSPPALARQMTQACGEKGAGFADAPIARTRQAAWDGTLAIMVGADDAALFDHVKPVLDSMGTDVVHCGGAGAGQAAKILNNMVLFETVMALAEAKSIAEGAGYDPAMMFKVMALGSGDSFALRAHGHKAILPDDYPERAFSVRYASKDLGYARNMATEAGIMTPGADALAQLFEQAEAAGDADRYFPVIRHRLTELKR